MAESGKKVSVITITYNRESLLPDTIESVLNQDFDDFEYIIVDDGSTDGTRSMVESYGDDRIRYFYLQHSGYLSRVRNFGLQKATGEYVTFIDSDDLWERQKLKTQVEILTRYRDAGFTICDVAIFDKNRLLKQGYYRHKCAGVEEYKGYIATKIVSGELNVFVPAVLFRRSCLDNNRLCNESFVCGDTDFFAELAVRNPVVITFEPMVKIRRHESNVSHTYGVIGHEEALVTLENFFSTGRVSKALYRQTAMHLHYRLGLVFWGQRDFRRAAAAFLASWQNNPFFWKAPVRCLQAIIWYLFRTPDAGYQMSDV